MYCASVFIHLLLREKIHCKHPIILRVTQDWVILSGKHFVVITACKGSESECGITSSTECVIKQVN